MSSPREGLLTALGDWLHDDARERVARWRGDPDAWNPEQVAERYAALRGPRGRELFEEATERGLLAGEERLATAAWLRELAAAPGRARAEALLADVLRQPVAYDSDYHPPLSLLSRMLTDEHPGHRRAIARDLEPWLVRAARALRSGRAEIEEAKHAVAWLGQMDPRADATPSDLTSAARTVLDDTLGAWQELSDRIAHSAGAPIDHWTDLAHGLRAPHLDARFDAARRWRRLAEHLRPLGLQEALASRARAEPGPATPTRLRPGVAAIRPPYDVRVAPGMEMGFGSERESAIALGRALAAVLTSPGLPRVLTQPSPGTVGRAVGGLLAHLHADPLFEERALHLSGADRRRMRELARGLEVWTLRTEAAQVLLAEHVDSSAFEDAARDLLHEAWGVEPSAALGAVLGQPLGSCPHASFRAARWVPSLYLSLRERFDEDWWRNPHAAEPIRAACARGGTLSVEAWAEELEARPEGLGERIEELLT